MGHIPWEHANTIPILGLSRPPLEKKYVGSETTPYMN